MNIIQLGEGLSKRVIDELLQAAGVNDRFHTRNMGEKKKFMIIRYVIFAIIYLILGVLTLEMILVHDRKASIMDQWIGMDDHGIQIIIVLAFPVFLLMLLLSVVIPKILWNFIVKPIRILIEVIGYYAILFVERFRRK